MNNYKKAVDKIEFSSDFEKILIEKLLEENNRQKEKIIKINSDEKRKKRKKLVYSVTAAAVACIILITGVAFAVGRNSDTAVSIIKGTVQSAVDAKSIENTQIILTKKALAQQKEDSEPSVITAVTDENGSFCVEVPTGEYTAQIIKDGFIESTVDISSQDKSDDQYNTLFLSPVMEENTYRAVLTWEKDFDLDLCLSLPDDKGGRYKLFYSQSDYVTQSGDSIASLDIDNMHGDGPETITFCPVGNGVYRLSVACYSALVKDSDSILSDSKPTVTLYKGNSIIGKYTLSSFQKGNVWTVFEIRNYSVKEINKISTVKSIDEAE